MVLLVRNVNCGQPASVERSDLAVETVAEGCFRAMRVRSLEQRRFSAKALRSICFFISITGLVANHPHLAAQQVTSTAPLSATAQDGLPEAPGTVQYPDAQLVPAQEEAKHAQIYALTETTTADGHAVLDGGLVDHDGLPVRVMAEVDYEGRSVQADHIDYDQDSGEVVLTGNVLVTGDKNDERMKASHATMNVKTGTGKFYDVTGSVGLKSVAKPGATTGVQPRVYENGNPFLFTGKLVVKTGPEEYEIYEGTLTSCLLPRPDWMLYSAKFSVDREKARAKGSVFHLMNVPLLWLPYVTHPVDSNARQSGFLIPTLPWYASTKGIYGGEQVYWAINRSTDMTLGTIYYSARGWSENGSFRYHGLGQNFAKARFSALQDRGYTPSGGVYTNQGGVEVTFSGRNDLTPETRAVADVDYLSSFLYREGFTDNFNQAISSDIVSAVYATHAWNGYAASVEGDRYQGEKRVQSTTPGGIVIPEQEVHIFHAPALEFLMADHRLGSTGVEWNVGSTVAALKRSQPNFVTSGMVERPDLRPEVAYPFSLGGWRVRPSAAVRETFYSRSKLAPAPGLGPTPVESTATLNRADIDMRVDVRPPVIERTFDSGFVKRLLRHDVKHTIEPDVTYRYINGITNFQQVLRFDMVDVASNTNEIQYGVTQRLFLRRTGKVPCHAAGAGANANEVLGSTGGGGENAGDPDDVVGNGEAAEPVCGNREWISWRVSQKYFFNPTFGGAVVDGRRNILDTTLDFSGIAFLTEPRNISPLISRLRVRTSEKVDVEWDFDYDTGAKKFTSDNVFVDVHQGNVFGGITYARLNAPGRSFVEGVASSVADFSQMRVLLGWGKPTKAGPSVAANAGLDLNLGSVQYGAVQASYNWNCCGLSVEYRKYELGTARNENAYRFNFTLANIGTAGNLRRGQQVF
jgi:LPS-assembly protein